MRLYEVTYSKNDWTSNRDIARVAASTAIKAAEYIGKKNNRFVGYGGRVTQVTELHTTVYVAK